jgi:SAM-dependent methyltransferase
MKNDLRPTERFTKRVDNYTKFRPSYSTEVITLLTTKLGLNKGSAIADLGSGTGIFSELLLNAGFKVFGVEPNDAMRLEAERRLSKYGNFTSVIGRGEDTGLPDDCVDLITVAQAFHWFEPMKSKKEFDRILKADGAVALLWNVRVNTTPQMLEYEKLKVDFGTDYLLTKRADENTIKVFFADRAYETYIFPNNQLLDFATLKGQLLSSSYIPTEEHPRFNDMMAALQDIFARYRKNGLIEIEQETKLYLGR